MQCEQVKKRLSAWADHEMTKDEENALAQHLAVCPDCRARAATEEELTLALDGLSPICAPRGFSKKVCLAARAGMPSDNMNQWWQQLSLAWRVLVCGMAMAGLLFGAVLATSLPATAADDGGGIDSLSYFTTSDDGGYY